MKKAGFIAASIGTAVVLAAGAAALTTALLSPNHGVEEANAIEVAAPANTSAEPASGNRGLFSWFGGGDRSSEPAAARSTGGERHVLPGVTRPTASSESSPTARAPARSSGDDDDDDDDDD